uniref:Uncharacterized protein n=1 Tax=viral metagenome TaxID=1070528 RepID=A0A6C0AXP5_9ZZZZ|tara:strand:+ start:45145 stop:45546 length:402 start_codon:yes stop_codon:yes gene_type:complete
MTWKSEIIMFKNKVINNIWNTKHNLYLYYIRYYISKANNIDDLLCIFKSIASNNKFVTTDELLNLITDCFIRYPVTEIELQKMSQWQQLYNCDLGVNSYITLTFWLCIIKAIQENESKNNILYVKTLKCKLDD